MMGNPNLLRVTDMKKLLLLLLMIPTLSFAVDRSHEQIKREVIFEFNLYDKGNKEAFSLSLAHTGVGTHLKGTLYIVDIDIKNKGYKIAVDIWDGEDLVWHTKGNAIDPYFLKNPNDEIEKDTSIFDWKNYFK